VESLALESIEFERDGDGRIIAVSGSRPDGARLGYRIEAATNETDVIATGTVTLNEQPLFSVTAQIQHTVDTPTMLLTASSGDETHYSLSAKLNAEDESLSLNGHSRGKPFSAQVEAGSDIPDEVPDVDDALPNELTDGLEPLIPLVHMVAGSAGQPKNPRKSWWRRLARYGCVGAAGAGAAAVCVFTVGIGCVAASSAAAVAGAICADVI